MATLRCVRHPQLESHNETSRADCDIWYSRFRRPHPSSPECSSRLTWRVTRDSKNEAPPSDDDYDSRLVDHQNKKREIVVRLSSPSDGREGRERRRIMFITARDLGGCEELRIDRSVVRRRAETTTTGGRRVTDLANRFGSRVFPSSSSCGERSRHTKT